MDRRPAGDQGGQSNAEPLSLRARTAGHPHLSGNARVRREAVTVSDIERAPEILPASAAPGPRLEEIWRTEPGLAGWLSTVDHKEIGKRYIVTALIFLVLGGIEALVMRVQLARPDQQLLTPEQYNQLFSTHGMTMIFLYALPILSGFSNYRARARYVDQSRSDHDLGHLDSFGGQFAGGAKRKPRP